MAINGSTALTATHTSPTDIAFDNETGRFTGITAHDLDVWRKTWPCVDIEQLIRIAEITVKHQPHLYPPTTIWRRMLCTRVFPHGKTIVGSIPLKFESESIKVEKNPEAAKLLGSDQGGETPQDVTVDKHILSHLSPSLSTVNKQLIGDLMSATYGQYNDNFIKGRKTNDLFDFLCDIALLTHRTKHPSIDGLKIGQARIRGWEQLGLTEKEYRCRKDKARKLGLLSFEGKTSQGTIATWLDNRVLVLYREENDERADDYAKKGRNKGRNETLAEHGVDSNSENKGRNKGRKKGGRRAEPHYILDEEEEKESTKESLLPFGDFVRLSEKAHAKLVADLGAECVAELIERVNNYCGSKGKTYVSYAHAIRQFAANARDRAEEKGVALPGKGAENPKKLAERYAEANRGNKQTIIEACSDHIEIITGNHTWTLSYGEKGFAQQLESRVRKCNLNTPERTNGP